jgi:hypothetical protein
MCHLSQGDGRKHQTNRPEQTYIVTYLLRVSYFIVIPVTGQGPVLRSTNSAGRNSREKYLCAPIEQQHHQLQLPYPHCTATYANLRLLIFPPAVPLPRIQKSPVTYGGSTFASPFSNHMLAGAPQCLPYAYSFLKPSSCSLQLYSRPSDWEQTS